MSTTGNTNGGFGAWWNSAGLAYKFSIGLGCCIVLVVIIAIIKLIYNKARLRGHIKREKAEKAARADAFAEEANIKRLSSLEEGDLFGVRAIQSGFYGGVAQSAPSSPMGSRSPSLYNQATIPSGPLNGSSPYMPLMQPQAAAASPMTSSTSLPLTRSPLGQNPNRSDGSPLSNGASSPIPGAILRDTQRPGTPGSIRPGTAASNRSFADQTRPSFPLERQQSSQSQKTINLDSIAPARSSPPANGSGLRPTNSDASNNTSLPSSKHGTSHGSRGSSFTSTYSFEEGTEQQPQNPTIVKPFEGLPTLPVLQPLSAEVHSGTTPSPSPQPREPNSPPNNKSTVTAELPAEVQRSPPRETNFSTPFRRPSQPESMISPQNSGFGPLPAAAMNGGPQQFSQERGQSPGPMQRGPPPFGTNSPGPFRPGQQQQDGRSMSPGPRNMPPKQGSLPLRGLDSNQSRNGSTSQTGQMDQKRAPPTPLKLTPQSNAQPSLPAFLQDNIRTTEVQIPRGAPNGPKTAPLTQTSSNRLMPQSQKKNRLTADILGEFYDHYQYERNSKDDLSSYAPNHHNYEMNRIARNPASLPGSPRQAYRQPTNDRRLI